MEEEIDRRKNPRFKLNKGVSATLQPGGERSGPIDDICRRGLSFSYISKGDWKSEPLSINIETVDDKFYLKYIPCRSIHDSALEKIESSGLLQRRKHGVEFGEITPLQRKKLKSLINEYATWVF
jgi:hypothetical protein